jgi:hypothetical protein
VTGSVYIFATVWICVLYICTHQGVLMTLKANEGANGGKGVKKCCITLKVTKKLRCFKEDAPGNSYYWKYAVLYSLGSLHTDLSFIKPGHPWNKGHLSLTLRNY